MDNICIFTKIFSNNKINIIEYRMNCIAMVKVVVQQPFLAVRFDI